MKTTNAIFPIGNKRAKSGKNARVGDMKRIRSGDGRAIQQLVSTAHKQASHSKHWDGMLHMHCAGTAVIHGVTWSICSQLLSHAHVRVAGGNCRQQRMQPPRPPSLLRVAETFEWVQLLRQLYASMYWSFQVIISKIMYPVICNLNNLKVASRVNSLSASWPLFQSGLLVKWFLIAGKISYSSIHFYSSIIIHSFVRSLIHLLTHLFTY